MATLWKTEYAVAVDGDEQAWCDSQAEAFEVARAASLAQPDADVTVTRLDHYLTERTEVGSFSEGVEAQEED